MLSVVTCAIVILFGVPMLNGLSDEYVLKIMHVNGDLHAYNDLSVLVTDFRTNITLGQTAAIDNAFHEQWNEEYFISGPYYLLLELMNGDETLGASGLAIGIGEVKDCQTILTKEIDLGGIDLFVEVSRNCDAIEGENAVEV